MSETRHLHQNRDQTRAFYMKVSCLIAARHINITQTHQQHSKYRRWHASSDETLGVRHNRGAAVTQMLIIIAPVGEAARIIVLFPILRPTHHQCPTLFHQMASSHAATRPVSAGGVMSAAPVALAIK